MKAEPGREGSRTDRPDLTQQASAVLALQRSVGNARVSTLLQRQQQPVQQAPAAMPAADVLTTRIAQAIGVWETNRGGNAPNPVESRLDTVAGVRASMATIEQATMPYALDALRQHAALRNAANPPLTVQEIDDAIARVTAVRTLLDSVRAASQAGTTPDVFIQNNGPQITATGLSNANVRTMFSAVGLKATIDAAHARVEAQASTLDQEVQAIPVADRLGLGAGSLRTYIRRPATWGENRAAWQRLAVQQMPNNIGTRIEAVAVSNQGTALAIPVIRGRVNAQLALNPQPTEEQLVRAVGAQNNPGEANYGANIWATYQRLFPPAPPPP